MGKRPKKKIFLFLVEGVSDRNALEVPFGQLLEDIDPDIVLEFAMLMQDDGSFGGDITSKNGIHPDNIERFIDEIMVSPLLKRTGNEDKPVYYPDIIVTANPDHVKERNLCKSANLDVLTSLSSIKIGSKKIKYSVYYFSSNLDHFLYRDANSDEHGKVRRAAEFSMKHETSGSLERFFEENETVTTDMTYWESWDFIKSGENSLKRHTNVNLLIKRLKAIAENHI